MKSENTVLYIGGGLVLILVLSKLSAQKASAAKANSSSLSGIIGGGIAAVGSIGKGLSAIFGGSNSSPVDIPTNNNGGSVSPGSPISPFFGPDINPTTGESSSSGLGSFFGPDINPGTGEYLVTG